MVLLMLLVVIPGSSSTLLVNSCSIDIYCIVQTLFGVSQGAGDANQVYLPPWH